MGFWSRPFFLINIQLFEKIWLAIYFKSLAKNLSNSQKYVGFEDEIFHGDSLLLINKSLSNRIRKTPKYQQKGKNVKIFKNTEF